MESFFFFLWSKDEFSICSRPRLILLNPVPHIARESPRSGPGRNKKERACARDRAKKRRRHSTRVASKTLDRTIDGCFLSSIFFALHFSTLLTPSCTAPIALSSASMASPWRRTWFSIVFWMRSERGKKKKRRCFSSLSLRFFLRM